MQLKLNRRYNIIIGSFIAIILISIIYLTLNPTIWANRRVEVIVIYVVVSTLFLVWFKYYENNADKNMINKMVQNGQFALAQIKDNAFEKIIKDSNNRKYPVWKLDVEIYDHNLNKCEATIYEKCDSMQTKMPRGYIYVTYDENKPDRLFVVPNMLLGICPEAQDIVSKYEANVKDIRYLNVYYHKGIIIEKYKESIKKSKEFD